MLKWILVRINRQMQGQISEKTIADET